MSSSRSCCVNKSSKSTTEENRKRSPVPVPVSKPKPQPRAKKPFGTSADGHAADDDFTGFFLEAPRKSLLDHMDEKREKDGSRKHIFHRLIYTGRHRMKDNYDQFAKYMEQSIKSTKIGASVPLTGVLLVYNDHFVHVTEGLYDDLFDLIKVYSEENNNDIIEDVVIVLMAHDISFACFCVFAIINLIGGTHIIRWESVTVKIHRNDELDLTKPNEIIREFLERIHNLMIYISNHTIEEMQIAVDALVESVRECFPSSVVVGCFSKLRLMSASQFVKTFRVPSDLVLDEEVVWPMMTNPYPLKMNRA